LTFTRSFWDVSCAKRTYERRWIAGVNFLGELPVKLRQAVLLINERVPSGTTMEDPETIAGYAGQFLGQSA
jgi:hypothetical protein